MVGWVGGGGGERRTRKDCCGYRREGLMRHGIRGEGYTHGGGTPGMKRKRWRE